MYLEKRSGLFFLFSPVQAVCSMLVWFVWIKHKELEAHVIRSTHSLFFVSCNWFDCYVASIRGRYSVLSVCSIHTMEVRSGQHGKTAQQTDFLFYYKSSMANKLLTYSRGLIVGAWLAGVYLTQKMYWFPPASNNNLHLNSIQSSD